MMLPDHHPEQLIKFAANRRKVKRVAAVAGGLLLLGGGGGGGFAYARKHPRDPKGRFRDTPNIVDAKVKDPKGHTPAPSTVARPTPTPKVVVTPPSVSREVGVRMPRPYRDSSKDRPQSDNPLSKPGPEADTGKGFVDRNKESANGSYVGWKGNQYMPSKRGWQKLDEKEGLKAVDGPKARPAKPSGRLPKAPEPPIPSEDKPDDRRQRPSPEFRANPKAAVKGKTLADRVRAERDARIEADRKQRKLEQAAAEAAAAGPAYGEGAERKRAAQALERPMSADEVRDLAVGSKIRRQITRENAELKTRRAIETAAQARTRRPQPLETTAVGDPRSNPAAFDHERRVVTRSRDGVTVRTVRGYARDLRPVTARVEMIDVDGRHIVMTRHGAANDNKSKEQWLIHGVERRAQLRDGFEAEAYLEDRQDHDRSAYWHEGGNVPSSPRDRPRPEGRVGVRPAVQYFDSEVDRRAVRTVTTAQQAALAREEKRKLNREAQDARRAEEDAARGVTPKKPRKPRDPNKPKAAPKPGTKAAEKAARSAENKRKHAEAANRKADQQAALDRMRDQLYGDY